MSRNGRNRKDEDNSFREWLSDHLRYLVLFIALLLALIVAAMIWSLLDTTGNLGFFGKQEIGQDETSPEPEIVIINGDQLQVETQVISEESETEGTGDPAPSGSTDVKDDVTTEESDGEMENAAPILLAGSSALPGSENAVTNLDTGASAVSAGGGIPLEQAETAATAQTNELIIQGSTPETSPETTSPESNGGGGSPSYDESSSGQADDYASSGGEEAYVSDSGAGEDSSSGYSAAASTPETQAPTYLTMTGACYLRSYPDYGDNILGTYGAGTVVRFYGEEAGWYKVEVDGQIGYMGPRFFR